MHHEWKEHRVLIWGKTYPELSTKYYETVCTGGTLEDGRFVRLYPIPFRYLEDSQTFSKFQWVRVRMRKSDQDKRPESYKVDPESIQIEESVATDKYGWKSRSGIIFRNNNYIFATAEKLFEANRSNKTSLGFVYPKIIDRITIAERPEVDYHTFIEKMEKNSEKLKQVRMFDDLKIQDVKRLQYVSKRFKVHWHCDSSQCNGHVMSIIDWEAYELVRKVGLQSAFDKLTSILDLRKYDVGFFLGNFKQHQANFAIGGIWRPLKTMPSKTLSLFP